MLETSDQFVIVTVTHVRTQARSVARSRLSHAYTNVLIKIINVNSMRDDSFAWRKKLENSETSSGARFGQSMNRHSKIFH